jgi:hypothetical protein
MIDHEVGCADLWLRESGSSRRVVVVAVDHCSLFSSVQLSWCELFSVTLCECLSLQMLSMRFPNNVIAPLLLMYYEIVASPWIDILLPPCLHCGGVTAVHFHFERSMSPR